MLVHSAHRYSVEAPSGTTQRATMYGSARPFHQSAAGKLMARIRRTCGRRHGGKVEAASGWLHWHEMQAGSLAGRCPNQAAPSSQVEAEVGTAIHAT